MRQGLASHYNLALSQWKFLRSAILQSYGAFFGVSQRRLLESSLAAAPLTWVNPQGGL